MPPKPEHSDTALDTSPDEPETGPRDDDASDKGPTLDTEDDAGTTPVDPQTGDDS